MPFKNSDTKPEDPEQERLFENAKAFLMQADADGQSVYDLLYKTVYAMLEENPEDVANHPEKLNEVLSLLKKHQFNGERVPTATARDIRETAAPSKAVHPTQAAEARRNLALLEQPKPATETKIERPSPGVTVTTTTVLQSSGPTFQSVAKDNSMWRFCGYGLPDQEAFLLDQSIAKLAREKKLEEVRFVGKIFGLRGNYLIVSSKRYVDPNGKEKIFAERYDTPKPPRKNTKVDVQPEPAYKGVNQKSFWVSSEAGAEWTLLPDTTPQNINSARNINKLFTGDLDAHVVVHPPFHNVEGLHGLEKEYLRAQLSRIVAATYIAPAGALERYENEEEEEEDDEDPFDENGAPKPPKPAKYQPLTVASKDYQPDVENGISGLTDLEQWVHSEPFVFKDGRMTKVPPKPEEDEEEEPEEPEDEGEDEDENAARADENEEEVEEEERDLFQPVKRDHLYGVVSIPREPNPDEEDEEEVLQNEEEKEEELDPEALAEKEREEEEALKKPVEDDDVADDDPLKKKVTAWTVAVTNAIYKKHGVAAVRSIRWPGAIAFAANGGKMWGSVYLGDGLKKTDYNFVPVPAPKIQRECKDLTEVADPTAANEKLVMRGEEPRENDSEDEQPDEEEEEN